MKKLAVEQRNRGRSDAGTLASALGSDDGGGGRLSGHVLQQVRLGAPGLRPASDGFTSFVTLVRFMEFETKKTDKSDQEADAGRSVHALNTDH